MGLCVLVLSHSARFQSSALHREPIQTQVVYLQTATQGCVLGILSSVGVPVTILLRCQLLLLRAVFLWGAYTLEETQLVHDEDKQSQ